MNLYNIIILYLCLLIGQTLWGQSTDTVVVKLEPLVVKKHVVIHEPVTPKQAKEPVKPDKWSIVLCFQTGKIDEIQTEDSIQKKFGHYQGLQIGVQKSLDERWRIGFGFGHESTPIYSSYLETKTKYDTILTMHIDSTLSAVTITPDKGIIYSYSYDTSFVLKPTQTKYKENSTHRTAIDHWNVPIQLGYMFSFGQIYLMPQIALGVHLSTSKTPTWGNGHYYSTPKIHLSFTPGIQIGLKISPKWGIELGGRYTQQMRSAKSYFKQNYFLGNIGLRYFFK